MTETADAGKLVTQLNAYFTEMVRIVFAHRGTLDKFMGDAVMAHWGGIVSRGEGPDACRAVAAALDMLQALPKLNAGWKARGFPELKIGLGVNHGDAICAYIGSDEKHEFTAIGDAVNFASRLEGATKQFHQDLLIGEKAAPLIADHYVLRSVDLIQVKGKTQPVEVFAVLGDRSEMKVPAWLASYEEGIRLFRQRAFDQAHAKFTEVLESIPEDWLSQEYIRRCEEYQVEAPAESWNGSYAMLTK
jgi:adenylate cyclase